MPGISRTNHLGIAVGLMVTLVSLSTQSLAGVCPYGATLPGVDVSQYDGSIIWTSVKATGIAFAYAKATEGTTYIDPTFAVNWPGMKAAGIVRGAYSFFHANADPIAEADHFLSVMGTLQPGDLPPMLDVEVTDGQSAATIAANVSSWVSHVHAATGRVPIIYTTPGFWNVSVGSTGFAANPLWAANWGVTCPTLAEGWTNWAIWQYSATGTVDGISGAVGAVDLDKFNGSMKDLLAFANQPSLNIAPKRTNQVALTWSTFAIGFGLQQNSTLGTTNWTSVTNMPTLVGNQKQVILGTSTKQTFFRLFHPP
jgi:lysozyme